MDNFARALLQAAAFLELSPDDVIDPNAAVKALEDIAFALSRCSPEEIAVLRRVCDEQTSLSTNLAARKFFRDFLYSVGLEEDPPAGSPN